MPKVKQRFDAKEGAPVLPNTRTILEHAKEYLLKLSRSSSKELQEDSDLSDLEALKTLAGQFANADAGSLLELFDKRYKVTSRLLDETVYVLPGPDHGGEGFISLHLGEELQYWDQDTENWRICELGRDSYVESDGQSVLEVLDFDKGFVKIEPWLIRRPAKVNK
jgi:hypothetical protein